MARPGQLKRLLAALNSLEMLDKTGKPLEVVAVARRIREAAEDLERAKVEKARELGVGWREIGSLYDISKQAAQQRFGARIPLPGARPGDREPPKRRAKRHVAIEPTTSRADAGAKVSTPSKSHLPVRSRRTRA